MPQAWHTDQQYPDGALGMQWVNGGTCPKSFNQQEGHIPLDLSYLAECLHLRQQVQTAALLASSCSFFIGNDKDPDVCRMQQKNSARTPCHVDQFVGTSQRHIQGKQFTHLAWSKQSTFN